MHPDLAALFARQHGLATSAQASDAGLTRGQVEGLLRRGRLESPHRGLLAAPGMPWTPEREGMAALLRCGSGARLVGPRALGLLGTRGFVRTDPFGVLMDRARDPRSRPDLAVFRDVAPSDGTITVDGLALAAPPRQGVELVRFLDGVALRSAIDAMAWARRPSKDELAAAAFALPSRYVPAARIRALVRSGVLRLDSEQERRLVGLLGRRFGRVETQVWVTPTRRVDVLLRDHGLVLEYDGATHRSEGGRARDLERDAEVRAAGFAVVHLWHEDLEHPGALLRRVRKAIHERVGSPRMVVPTRPRGF